MCRRPTHAAAAVAPPRAASRCRAGGAVPAPARAASWKMRPAAHPLGRRGACAARARWRAAWPRRPREARSAAAR
eukprot:scaffold60951_cov63-Phaeocystis_antarctica.AAC.1